MVFQPVVSKACPICTGVGIQYQTLSQTALLHCKTCGVEFADYPAESAGNRDHFDRLDEQHYLASVGQTRIRSFQTLIPRVQSYCPTGRWLDVGCSYGWLLTAAQQVGYLVEGIEPSHSAAAVAEAAGHRVRQGTYPDVLSETDDYGIVSFIDVLEHLPNPVGVLQQLHSQLAPGGVVIIQVPDQVCLLYWLAKSLCRVTRGRMDFALRRLWLTELDFPHRFYFHQHSLAYLLHHAGYRVLEQYRSPISGPGEATSRVGYYGKDAASQSTVVARMVGAINAIDTAWGHGGLLTTIAQPLGGGA